MITVLLTFCALVFLLVVYVVHVRPYLEERGYVRKLPDHVVSMRDRLCASVRNSASILWGKLLMAFGAAWEIVLVAANALNDPELKASLLGLGLGEWFGVVLAVVGFITVIARMRTARAEEPGDA